MVFTCLDGDIWLTLRVYRMSFQVAKIVGNWIYYSVVRCNLGNPTAVDNVSIGTSTTTNTIYFSLIHQINIPKIFINHIHLNWHQRKSRPNCCNLFVKLHIQKSVKGFGQDLKVMHIWKYMVLIMIYNKTLLSVQKLFICCLS